VSAGVRQVGCLLGCQRSCRQGTLNPKVQGSIPCASTTDSGVEFKSTPYLGVADAMCHIFR
jgi:hypothetical protein